MSKTNPTSNPSDKVERWPIERLIPYARNARTHSDEQVAQIAASIKEWGWTTPVLVDEGGGIIAGHGRLLAAQRLSMTEVPVMVARGWTDAQKRAYVIADNKLTLNAGWDNELLALELSDLKGLDFDLDLTGFSADEIAALQPVQLTEGLTDEDAVPDAPVNPVTVPGDVWILGKHRVMCGDSKSVDAVGKLMGGKKADMVFTDPPYGVDYDGGRTRREKIKNDDTTEIYAAVMPVIYSVSNDCAAVYIWFSDSKSAAVTAAGYEIRNTLIWNKNMAQFGAIGAQYKSKHEPCLYCFKNGHSPYWQGPNNEISVWDINRSQKNEYHPTQKPVELAERALGNSSKLEDTILDLFGGSGSTLIACEKTGRINRSMELDPIYCDVIVKRWQDFTGKQAVNEASGKAFDACI